MIAPIWIKDKLRYLGCRPTSQYVKALFRVFGEEPVVQARLIPRANWQETIFADPVWHIFDQQNTNGCTGHGVTGACMATLEAIGEPRVLLWPGQFYGQINGGSDNGASIGEALLAAMRNGLCPLPEGMASHVWKEQYWPKDWRVQAAQHKVLEAYYCPTFDHLVSAALCGFATIFGIYVGNDFDADAEGWVPEYRRGNGAHCIYAKPGLRWHVKRKTWGLSGINAWGLAWGHQGQANIPQSYFDRGFDDGWAVRALVHATPVA